LVATIGILLLANNGNSPPDTAAKSLIPAAGDSVPATSDKKWEVNLT
jgi:hypothetical protein